MGWQARDTKPLTAINSGRFYYRTPPSLRLAPIVLKAAGPPATSAVRLSCDALDLICAGREGSSFRHYPLGKLIARTKILFRILAQLEWGGPRERKLCAQLDGPSVLRLQGSSVGHKLYYRQNHSSAHLIAKCMQYSNSNKCFLEGESGRETGL